MTIKFQVKTLQGWTIDSPLTPIIFPDGAAHIQNADTPTEYEYHIADVRGLDHTDLFTLAMYGEAVMERGERLVLILPYLPGARMDRGNPVGAAVYHDFIHSVVEPSQIITIDPHSQAAADFYERGSIYDAVFTVFPVERIIRKEVQDASRDSKANATYAGVIAPDKGAHDRAAAAATVMGVPVYHGGKTRDFNTGKLTGFHMEDELPDEGRFLIVDDIGDGMGTFKGLADVTGLGSDRLDLWVTHLILSKGEVGLRERFGVIHTTDSYWEDDSSDFIKVHRLTPYLYPEISV